MIERAPRDDRGRLLRHLPAIYQEAAIDQTQPSLAPFLGALEAMLFEGTDDQPGVASIIAGLPRLMLPDETPDAFVPWLASWVGLSLHPDLSLDTQRALLRHAVPLYQRRGTKSGLQQLLDIVTAGAAQVVEPESAGFRLGDVRVGRTARIGRDRPHFFEVLMETPRDDRASIERLVRVARAFIDHAKPAHTEYSLTVGAAAAPDPERRRHGVR